MKNNKMKDVMKKILYAMLASFIATASYAMETTEKRNGIWLIKNPNTITLKNFRYHVTYDTKSGQYTQTKGEYIADEVDKKGNIITTGPELLYDALLRRWASTPEEPMVTTSRMQQ